MKYIKLFEEHTANGPAEVKVGDTVTVVHEGPPFYTGDASEEDYNFDSEVFEIFEDGRILVSDHGHKCIAKYDDGYDGYVIDEDYEK
jgi:hypothetical protein